MAYKKQKKKLNSTLGERITMRQNRGRVQINPKSYGKRQTTWRREKIETKGRNREEIKAAEEKKRKKKKERDFNVNISQ